MKNRRIHQKENKSGISTSYKVLIALRLILAVVPQTGYIHPDEYFQSIEILIGDIFDSDRSEVWEFDAGNPLRNVLIPYIVYGIPLFICKQIFNYLNVRGTVSPYFLIIPCRLVICLLSFIIDFSLLKICRKYGTNIEPRLLMLASSYTMLVYGSRTFSNTIEMILFSGLLRSVVTNVLEAEEAYPRQLKLHSSLETTDNPRQRVLIMRQLKQLSHPSYSGSTEIAVLCVLGIFNRPTFVVFAIGPVFFWIYRGPPMRQLSLYTIHLRWACLITVALPMIVVFLVADTMYYKRHEAFNKLFNVGALACLNQIGDCLVITPFNFIKYNLNSDNLVQHGLHPRYLHLLNILLLYNVLGVYFLHMVVNVLAGVIYRKHMFKFDSITGLMFVSVALPVFLLSLFAHQEPRFLIPVTLPLIFLCAAVICNRSGEELRKTEYPGKKIFITWISLNLLFVCFYGFIHQGGVLPALRRLTNVKNGLKKGTRLHVVSSHVYTLPKSLLTNAIQDDTSKSSFRKLSDVIIYSTSSSTMDVPLQQLETIVDFIDRTPSVDDVIYFIFPTSLTTNFTRSMASKQLKIRYSLECYIPFHLSLEALPEVTWSTFWNLKFLNGVGLNVLILRTVKYFKNNELNGGYFKTTDEPSTEQLLTRSSYLF